MVTPLSSRVLHWTPTKEGLVIRKTSKDNNLDDRMVPIPFSSFASGTPYSTFPSEKYTTQMMWARGRVVREQIKVKGSLRSTSTRWFGTIFSVS